LADFNQTSLGEFKRPTKAGIASCKRESSLASELTAKLVAACSIPLRLLGRTGQAAACSSPLNAPVTYSPVARN
jgi:hypothetical protein